MKEDYLRESDEFKAFVRLVGANRDLVVELKNKQRLELKSVEAKSNSQTVDRINRYEVIMVNLLMKEKLENLSMQPKTMEAYILRAQEHVT